MSVCRSVWEIDHAHIILSSSSVCLSVCLSLLFGKDRTTEWMRPKARAHRSFAPKTRYRVEMERGKITQEAKCTLSAAKKDLPPSEYLKCDSCSLGPHSPFHARGDAKEPLKGETATKDGTLSCPHTPSLPRPPVTRNARAPPRPQEEEGRRDERDEHGERADPLS